MIRKQYGIVQLVVGQVCYDKCAFWNLALLNSKKYKNYQNVKLWNNYDIYQYNYDILNNYYN